MSETLVQIKVSLSEAVVARIDELVAQLGMKARGPCIDCLLREVLFEDDESEQA